MALLEIENLRVSFTTPAGQVEAVRGVSLSLQPGEALAVVGDSGSGKSQTMLAAFGLLARNGRAEGSVRFNGQELIGAPAQEFRQILGRDVAFVFQDPLSSLTPHLRIGAQVAEAVRIHEKVSRREAKARALELLARMRLPEPEEIARRYPHQLSGGQRQRVMIASALAARPKLLIADEPTTALDVTVQADILDLLAELRREHAMALVFITHDLAVAARVADRIAVLRHGEVVEEGPARRLITSPEGSYTRVLADASILPAEPLVQETPSGPPLLTARGLCVDYTRPHGLFGTQSTRALTDVNLDVYPGEAIGIVGESGSGKSTLIRALLGLVRPAAGEIRWQDKPLRHPYPRRLREQMQIIHQDPFAALNPRRTIGQSISEPLEIHRPNLDARGRRALSAVWLDRVGLPADFLDRYPHELSGGQNQRVNIARALIATPRLLACDEAVSALDAETKAEILALLQDLQAETGIALLFVTHDFQAVARLCPRTIVVQCSKIVDAGDTASLMTNPSHPYTGALIDAIPRLTAEAERRTREHIQ